MTRHYTNFAGHVGSAATWKGKADWLEWDYPGGATTLMSETDALMVTLWADVNSTLLANNKNADALKRGVGIAPMGPSWTTSGSDVNPFWNAPWKQWLPLDSLSPNHAIRADAGDRNYEVDGPGGADVVTFSKSLYNQAVAKMNTIFANTVDQFAAGGGATNQMVRTMAQLNEDHTKIFWDDSPAWITAVTAVSNTECQWTVINATDFYNVYLWAKISGTWTYVGNVASTTNHIHTGLGAATEFLVSLGRANDNFCFQTFNVTVTDYAPDLTLAEHSDGVAATCDFAVYPQISWQGNNMSEADIVKIYRKMASGDAYTLIADNVVATDRSYADSSAGRWQTTGASVTLYLRYKVALYQNGVTFIEEIETTATSQSVNSVRCADD